MPSTKDRDNYTCYISSRTSKRDLEIIDKWRIGQSFAQIGLEYGLSRQRIERIVKKNGEPKSINAHTSRALELCIYPAVKEAIKNKKLSLIAIAEHMHISHRALLHKLRGEYEFKLSEMFALRDFLQPGVNIEELFAVVS